jgi:hypothetical protein
MSNKVMPEGYEEVVCKHIEEESYRMMATTWLGGNRYLVMCGPCFNNFQAEVIAGLLRSVGKGVFDSTGKKVQIEINLKPEGQDDANA